MSENPHWYLRLVDGEPVPFAAAVAERIFNRDAVIASVPLGRVEWRTGEATFEPDTSGCESGEIRLLSMRNFTCIVLLERLHELLVALGGVYVSTGGFVVAREDERDCLGPDSTTEVIVARSLDDFIDAVQIIFHNCGPDAYLRTA